MQRIDTAERRRRIAVRQHLAPACRAADVTTVAGDLVGIHATDPASVYLGAWARVTGLTHDEVAAALYEERSVLKVVGMRRTMFAAPRDLAGVINAAAARAIGVAERKRLIQMLEGASVAPDVPAWLAEVEAQTIAALDELGAATATQLTRRVPGMRIQITFGEGKKWAGKVGVSTRVLFMLSAEGRVIRGRPRGTWLSSMYEWSLMERWLGGTLIDPPLQEARADLVRRWLETYGPGTVRDIKWWTGWTLAAVKQALTDVEAIEVELDEGQGFVLPDDTAATIDHGEWVALLPALDTTTMAWKDRAWYLGGLEQRLYDSAGNAGPTIWLAGRIVGGWSISAAGRVVYQLLDQVSRESIAAIDSEVARLQEWLGTSRVIPRFRTPLELELTAA